MSCPTDLLLELADSLPSEGIERERALSLLARYLAASAASADLPRLAPPTLRLTRRDLLDLYGGFALGVFVPAVSRFRPRRSPPAAQTHLQERLLALLSLPPARDEAFRWTVAALRGDLPDLLARELSRPLARRSLNLVQTLSPSESDRTPQYEFGLALLALLAPAEGRALSAAEFAALLQTMDAWVARFPYFPESRLRDLFPLLARFSLTEEQRAALRERLLAWSDLERFPCERPFARRRDYVRALTRAWGWRGSLAWLAEGAARFLSPGPVLPKSDEETLRRDRRTRLSTLILALGALAPQDEAALAAGLDLFAELTRREQVALSFGHVIECDWALMDLLPGLLAHPACAEKLIPLLEAARFYAIGEMTLSDLRQRRLTLRLPALRALLDLRRRLPHHGWIRQVWGYCAGLEPAAEAWLSAELRAAPDPVRLEAALLLAAPRPGQDPSPDLSDALASSLTRFLLQAKTPFDPAWTAGLLQNREALRQVFLRLAEQESPGEFVRDFLRLLAAAVDELPVLSPALLAAAWLAAPEDALGAGLPPSERLGVSAQILAARRSEQEILAWLGRSLPPADPSPQRQRRLQERGDVHGLRVSQRFPRLQAVLFEEWTGNGLPAGAPRRRALARALASASPCLALPLLRDLFRLACEMHTAWHITEHHYTELYREAGPLAQEVACSLCALSPLLPEAVALLRDLLLTPATLPEGGFHELNPAFVYGRLLPLLAHKPVDESALPLLLDLARQPAPEAPPDLRALLRQMALQALANVRTLTEEQQEALWSAVHASSGILTRALGLLALGRQRPLSETAWQEVNRLLRRSPISLLLARHREVSRLPERYAEFPGHVFLLGGVAVGLAGEWLQEEGLLPASRRTELLAALRRAASEFRRLAEARLAESTHPHLGAETSFARSLACSLGDALGLSPDDDPDRLLRPADLARTLLLRSGELQDKAFGLGG